MGHATPATETAFGRFVSAFEENTIALILGAMTLITFANVIARKIFNSSIIWGQEVTLILFAWLVLFGIAYGFKITSHLGVDAVTNMLPKKGQRVMALLSGLACLLYALLMMKGAWDYYANFANLPQTTGRWFPTGLQEMKIWDQRGYTPTKAVPMVEWLRPLLEYLFLPEGEEPYEKFPLAVAYLIIPISVALMVLRIVQAILRILRGEQNSLIVSHEAEEEVDRVARGEFEE
ncbi:TRAP transporter small permease [Candidatus Halocynthiibacter alkanivorans]|jgi:C4-dicarboxylate transporter, DctQ subunit|uniref:TRAP transporter small permease n=1 Tax=Candidatus Halocynthiibacter alkanivorans TaxID=2267619 RepID=UPI000DF2800D|nr:TRAP transporter small permease [Candidatus Halocynthiibacter alkanivorans]